MACGTGAVASALVAVLLEQANPPVTVITSGGEKLTIHFSNLTLQPEFFWKARPIEFTGGKSVRMRCKNKIGPDFIILEKNIFNS